MNINTNRSRAWWLLFPSVIFLGLGFIYPVGTFLLESFKVPDGIGLANYQTFLTDELNLEVYWRTVRIALLVTLVSAIVSYPAALAIMQLGAKYRGLLTGLIILPLMISPVARSFAWLVVLGREGLLNKTLVGSGLLKESIPILYTESAVFIGLLQLMLPLMLLSLTSALENLPRDVQAAARSLGANSWQVFWRVILPLTRDGLAIGGTLVFTGCITAYVTPALLGGPRVTMLATLLYQKASVTVDEAATTVISVVMLLTTLAVNAALRSRNSRSA
jgi:putative spermidine/putrescine transport system permease protein